MAGDREMLWHDSREMDGGSELGFGRAEACSGNAKAGSSCVAVAWSHTMVTCAAASLAVARSAKAFLTDAATAASCVKLVCDLPPLHPCRSHPNQRTPNVGRELGCVAKCADTC